MSENEKGAFDWESWGTAGDFIRSYFSPMVS